MMSVHSNDWAEYGNARPGKAADILLELAEMQRQASSLNHMSIVHPKPAKDSHYPFPLARKSRTKPHSSVCVWCISLTLLAHPACPALKTRASGIDADWESWLRGMCSAGMWEMLAGSLSPLFSMQRIDPSIEVSQFCADVAGSILECALRQLRGTTVEHRDLMAQIRSAKYHKVRRVAAMIEDAYTSDKNDHQ